MDNNNMIFTMICQIYSRINSYFYFDVKGMQIDGSKTQTNGSQSIEM